MWSIDTDTNGNNTYNYTQKDHPNFVEFTIDEVTHAGHDAGTAGTHWYISVVKDLGNGSSRKYYGVGIHVEQWFTLFKRELDRARQGLEPTRYMVG
jgi:hypothetical protein